MGKQAGKAARYGEKAERLNELEAAVLMTCAESWVTTADATSAVKAPTTWVSAMLAALAKHGRLRRQVINRQWHWRLR